MQRETLIFTLFSPTYRSSSVLLIDPLSIATEMVQISKTNYFLVIFFSDCRQRAWMPFENSRVGELPSTTPLPCQPAARAIPLQYASPPVDLVRMLFISPQTNRIADEHLDYTASLSLSSLSGEFLLRGCNQTWTHLPLFLAVSPLSLLWISRLDIAVVCLSRAAARR